MLLNPRLSRLTHVVRETQHNLRSSVPPSGYILRHETLVSSRAGGVVTAGAVSTSQAKVTDLEFTISVYEEVTRLQIAMKDVCGMDIFETAQSLIDEGLEVSVGERLL